MKHKALFRFMIRPNVTLPRLNRDLLCGLLFPREDPWKQLTGLKQTGEGSDKCSERVFVPYISTKYLGGFL